MPFVPPRDADLFPGTRSALMRSGVPRLGTTRNRASAGGQLVQTFAQALTGSDSAGWNGFNLRILIPAAQLSQSGSGVRARLQSATGGTEGFKIATLYVGHRAGAGNIYDMDGSQVALLSGAVGAYTIPNNSQLITDISAFAFDEARDIIFSAYCDDAGNDITKLNALANVNYYHKSGANEASASVGTGVYTAVNNNLILVNRIDVVQ